MRPQTRIARRYAQALAEVAEQRGVLERVEEEFRQLVTLMEENVQWRQILTRPHLAAETKMAVLGELLDGRLSPVMANFLRLVVRKRREAYLPAMFAAFSELVDERRGILRVSVRSAAALTAAEVERLRSQLSQATGRQVEMTVEVDPSLLAGVVVRMGDRIIDGSVASRLKRLGEHLRAADIRVG